ncbi:6-bladed beta-propeller [Gracilimonas sp.]|uniref:6-bladed beta-propeller n=1 Tax=Gracilimonas sp. TaxID=1974203 RepID=UPI003BA9B2BD
MTDVLTFTPEERLKIDHTGDRYFDHLGYQSVVLKNERIVLPDRGTSNILVINKNGEFQSAVEKGRGPGEILDAYNFTKTKDGGIFTFDQKNDKILEFDSQLNLVQELIPPPFENTSIRYVYDLNETLVFELTSFGFLDNPDLEKKKIFVQYFPSSEEYGKRWSVKDKPYAILRVDGRAVGAGQVPFTYDQLTAYNPENNSLFIFGTNTNKITEIDAEYDTLSVVKVSLPVEPVNQAELDSLKGDNRSEQWKTMKELVPEVKSPADKMMYYDGEFWLKSNLRGNHIKWFVLNRNGEVLRVVQLPKESILMHVSEEHLGVRLDDVTFALYENPK